MPPQFIKEPASNDYQLTLSKRVFDPQWGYSWLYRYEGNIASLDALADSWIDSGWRIERTDDGAGIGQLEVYISDPAAIGSPGSTVEVTEQWTWESEFYTRDIYSSPLISSDPPPDAPAAGSVTRPQIAIIEKAVKHFRAGEAGYETERAKLDEDGASENALALAVLDQRTRGAEYDEVDIPSLLRQRTYSIQYASRRRVDMVEAFYSSSRLISNEVIPLIIQNTMPINPTLKPPNTEWGWKERSNSLDLIPQIGKAVETTRWSFNTWSTLTYKYIA